jgi:hypothetical protein
MARAHAPASDAGRNAVPEIQTKASDLRAQATSLRDLARREAYAPVRERLTKLAIRCDEIARNIERITAAMRRPDAPPAAVATER